MPNCGRIKKYIIEEGPSDWTVTFDVSPPAEAVGFSALIQNALPGAVSGSTATLIEEFEQVRRTTVVVPKAVISRAALESYFAILRWTVTIADDADESHAIYLHTLPHPGNEPGVAEMIRTRIGNLVYKAKSYTPSTGSKPAASDLAQKFVYWLERHPQYMKAHVIVPVPPSNKAKAFDLPAFVAKHIATELDLEVATCTKARATLSQKEVGDDLQALEANVKGSFAVENDLLGQTVVIVDDIYSSGHTVNELVRACRAAGAFTVLSLTATKTAKYCNGFPPSDWYRVSMEAANPPTEDRDE